MGETRRGAPASPQARQGLDTLIQQQPLLLGAAGLALGALLGGLLPRTETEDRLMGDARDQLVERGRAAVQGGAAEVKDRVADEVGEAREQVAGKGSSLSQAAAGVGAAVTDAARRLAEQAKEAIHDKADEAKVAIHDTADEAQTRMDAARAGDQTER